MIIFAQSKLNGPLGARFSQMTYAKTNVRHVNFLLPISKMTNDSCILWIGAYEQSYDGADEITYIPPERLFDRDYF